MRNSTAPENYDRLRGLYFDGIVLDEYADMDPRSMAASCQATALSDRKRLGNFHQRRAAATLRIWNGDAEQDVPSALNSDEWFHLMLRHRGEHRSGRGASQRKAHALG